jgi:hypothetical protein
MRRTIRGLEFNLLRKGEDQSLYQCGDVYLRQEIDLHPQGGDWFCAFYDKPEVATGFGRTADAALADLLAQLRNLRQSLDATISALNGAGLADIGQAVQS